MTRVKAFGIHLLLSAVVALSFAALCRFYWFSGPLFEISGAVGLLFIMVPVDAILGPLLTLLVFKSGKPSLKFDLSVIVFLQLAALVYGAYVMAQARPLYGVLYYGELRAVRGGDINSGWSDVLFSPTRYVQIPDTEGALPSIEEEFAAATGGTPLYFQTQRYRPINDLRQEFKVKATPLDELESKTLKDFLRTKADDLGLSRVAIIPVIALGGKHWGIVDMATGELVTVINAAEL